MYVDESGDDVMAPAKWSSPDARYLGLTGVVIASETYRTRTHPEFEALKQEFFPHDPDYPVILVRKQILQRRGIFLRLQNPDEAQRWENRILQFFDIHVRRVFTAVLDKESYGKTSLAMEQRPYSHCVNALTVMYGQWLNQIGGTGDVMVEARRGKADTELQEDFHKLMEDNGNRQESLGRVAKRILLKRKDNDITGLQLADLFVYPAMRGVLLENVRSLTYQPSSATLRFIEALQSKCDLRGKVLLS